jgi:transcriptional regulator with XRE-family HTH domain
MSQEQLADAIGVAQGVIAAIERRDSKTSQYAPQIAAALGVTLEELILDEKAAAVRNPRDSLAPNERLLVELFKGLTKRQQDAFLARLKEVKEQNDELLVELCGR